MTTIQQPRVGQRYQLGQRVKKRATAISKKPRFGTVLEAIEGSDSRNHPMWYYSIQWDDLKSPSIHAQHALVPEK